MPEKPESLQKMAGHALAVTIPMRARPGQLISGNRKHAEVTAD